MTTGSGAAGSEGAMIVVEPTLIPIYGCPQEHDAVFDTPAAKWGATWPTYICACDVCGTEYVWCDAHWEGGQHYTCDGCSGYPFCSCTVRHKGPCSVDTQDAKHAVQR